MRTAIAVTLMCICVALSGFAQTAPPPSAFETTTLSFALSPITLPSTVSTLSGAETDLLMHFTPNNVFGATSLISSSTFVGGRYEHAFPSIANYLQNHTSLTGGNFQAGVTASLGVVKADKERWGERAGFFLKYAPSGATNFNLGIDVEWNNLPGIAHHIPSIAIGPNFRFGS